jgi:hypothetical protein
MEDFIFDNIKFYKKLDLNNIKYINLLVNFLIYIFKYFMNVSIN